MVAKVFNLIYNTNTGPIGPSGGTPGQAVAGVASISVYTINPGQTPQTPNPKSVSAASVIQSNGELIGNAQLPNNPLPPGLSS